jgi:hypothetical protein
LFFHFNPTVALQVELNKTHTGVTLEDLHWPDAVNSGIHTLRLAQKAAFLLYCISAGLIILATTFSLFSFFIHGRLSAFIDILLWTLAFFAALLASAITTAVAVKATHVVNRYGRDVGVAAKKGKGFMVLTWVAVGLCGLNVFVWVFECLRGRRRANRESFVGRVGK